MKRTAVEKIATLAAGADGNCPCNCHDPAVCKVSEPFGHHDCVECWTALIKEICSLEESESRAESESLADAVWAVLVGVCGASPDERDDFVHHALRTTLLEYRFQGNLGFGGKVYMGDPPRVSCYKEDENPVRRVIIDGANALLAAIARLDRRGNKCRHH